MDDNKKRTISTKTLEIVKDKINPVILSSLPARPEEILAFAQRRTAPVISKNIDSNLAKKMRAFRLSDEDYLITLFIAMADVFYNKNKSNEKTASILLAQTGAGKTNLRTALLQKYPNTVIINSDQYKKFRPDAEAILATDPTHFGALTGIDSYDHASNIMEFAALHGYDILIECAPSLQQGLIGVNLNALKKLEYNTKFHVMAVGNLVSALAIHLRYEHELALGRTNGETKLTDLKRHNESYLALEKIIEELDPAEVMIYRRGTEKEGKKPINIQDESKKPIEILRGTRTESNDEYIKTGAFIRDHKLILESMNHRRAPQLQQEQLSEIYKMFMNYIEKSKEL